MSVLEADVDQDGGLEHGQVHLRPSEVATVWRGLELTVNVQPGYRRWSSSRICSHIAHVCFKR